jgi:hypothetical protein
MERDTKEALDLFEKELTSLINKHSLESFSDTPDFILASYLRTCLEAYNKSQRRRQEWYSEPIQVGITPVDEYQKRKETEKTETDEERNKRLKKEKSALHKILGIKNHWARVYDKEGNLLCPQFTVPSEICGEYYIAHVVQYLKDNTKLNIRDVYKIKSPWRGTTIEFGPDRITPIVDMFNKK